MKQKEEHMEIETSINFKRVGAYIINIIIIFIPVFWLAEELAWILNDKILWLNSDDGLSTFAMFVSVVVPWFNYLVGFSTVTIALNTMSTMVVACCSYIIVETLTALIFRNDIGSLPFGLIIVDKHGNRASRWRIVLRTFLKYLTVFLCPILLLFPLFNRRNACLHELISGAYKVEKPKPVYPPMYYPPQQQ